VRVAGAVGLSFANTIAVLAFVTADASAINTASRGSVIHCGSTTVGPTVIPSGKAGGALCLLRAYRSNCQPAVYSLSMFGIDTITRDNFRVVKELGRCRINVATSFRVVPQKPRPGMSGQCSMLTKRGADIVASGCVGKGLPASISLTGTH
jgi:hypothetical protein